MLRLLSAALERGANHGLVVHLRGDLDLHCLDRWVELEASLQSGRQAREQILADYPYLGAARVSEREVQVARPA